MEGGGWRVGIGVWAFAFVLMAPGASRDVCALLADGDVQAAVGERVTARTAGPNQCQLTTSGSHAVSLAVTEPGREYWRTQFHAGKDTKKAKDTKGHHAPPRRIDGLGDEAYWTGAAMAGALYALAGDAFIRVSVGGYRTEQERIEKSTLLAKSVLQQLGRK